MNFYINAAHGFEFNMAKIYEKYSFHTTRKKDNNDRQFMIDSV